MIRLRKQTRRTYRCDRCPRRCEVTVGGDTPMRMPEGWISYTSGTLMCPACHNHHLRAEKEALRIRNNLSGR
jgi:hypothetical protein